MTEQALPLITFYSGWGVYQQNLVEVKEDERKITWKSDPVSDCF